jgi:hypothetical protein
MPDGLTITGLLIDLLKLIKTTNKDQEVFVRLLRRLADFGLLTQPFKAEYAGAVVDSAERLRTVLNSAAQEFSVNSQIVQGVLALGKVTRQFLNAIDGIEYEIRQLLDLFALNKKAGYLHEDQDEFLSHWIRCGYPDRVLRNNQGLSVMDIWWELHKIKFFMVLGEFRGRFGLVLSSLCELTTTELPDDLASLTPGVTEADEY